MSRHTALHESMQKIETSISSRADEDRECLCEEGRRLNTLLLSERGKLDTNEDTDTSYQNRLVSMITDQEVIREELVAAKNRLKTTVTFLK